MDVFCFFELKQTRLVVDILGLRGPGLGIYDLFKVFSLLLEEDDLNNRSKLTILCKNLILFKSNSFSKLCCASIVFGVAMGFITMAFMI